MHKIRYYKSSFMFEFIYAGLNFVQDENNFINPVLPIVSGSGSSEKVPDPAGQKSTDPTRSGSSSLPY